MLKPDPSRVAPFGFVTDGFCQTIGRTPLIRLHKLSEATGCEIWGKAEFLNPGGSVKDRAALGIVLDAEASGALQPGGTIVEGTAGNTGIGLALVGNARGYHTVIVIPETQSKEKIEGLRAMGAEVRTVPEKPYKDPDNYIRVSQRVAEQIPNGFWANQFDNVANRLAHYESTGPEIWEQTLGRLTGFVASVGTGGTLAGIALYLKEQNPDVKVIAADPYGAAIWSWVKLGHTDIHDGDSVAEGIGQGRVTKNLEGVKIDDAYRIPDDLAMEMLYHLLHAEGLFLSLSSAINVCGAAKLAKEGGPGQVIATILCDSGSRYVSRLYNPHWLQEKGLTPNAKGLEFLDRL
ncbi:MAG: cysteine synthase A [Verrucomicrobia bacterium]|nr:cysteine synthase A [Verrucomicrobiota bacterium]